MKQKSWNSRFLSYILTFCIGASLFTMQMSSAPVDALTLDNGLSYWVEQGTVTITSCPKDCEDIVIPETVNDLPVTAIRENAFSNCKSLTSITFPNSVQQIGNFAFFGCDGLTTLTLGNGILSIGAQAFCSCVNLTTVVLGASVSTMDASTFSFCASLTGFEVPAANQTFRSEEGVLFSKDGGTLRYYPEGKTDESYTIPEHVRTIGDHAFFNNTAICILEIPDTVTKLEPYAFSDCKGITKIALGAGIQELEPWVFAGCSGLESIIIPNTVFAIHTKAFYRCMSLTYIRFGKGLTNVGYLAFGGTPWLTAKREKNPMVIVNQILVDGATCAGDITFPDTVIAIADGACYNAKRITAITVPASVTRIGEQAFANCTALQSLTILNPDCTIYQADDTLSTTATISGYTDSTAEAFATTFENGFQSLGQPPATSIAPVARLMGDVNCNGVVEIGDVIMLNRYLAEDTAIIISELGMVHANFDDSNQIIDANDSSLLLRFIARNVEA